MESSSNAHIRDIDEAFDVGKETPCRPRYEDALAWMRDGIKGKQRRLITPCTRERQREDSTASERAMVAARRGKRQGSLQRPGGVNAETTRSNAAGYGPVAALMARVDRKESRRRNCFR